jgi:hypothetical protein
MKSQLLKLSLVLVVVAGAVFALRSQPSSSPMPSNTYDSGNDGRFKLVVTTGSYGDKQYVIDSRTGRVWHSVADQQKQMIVFVTYTYENIDGDLSTIPNETAAGVVSKSPAASSSQLPSSSPSSGDAKPFNFFDAAKQK